MPGGEVGSLEIEGDSLELRACHFAYLLSSDTIPNIPTHLHHAVCQTCVFHVAVVCDTDSVTSLSLWFGPGGFNLFSRQGIKLVPSLALLGSLIGFLSVSARLQAQPPAPATGGAAQPAWIMKAADVKQYFGTEYFRDKNALKGVNPGGDQVKQIKRIVHAFISQLTQENRENLPKVVVDRLLGDLHFPSTTPAARVIAMDEVVAVAPDILKLPDELIRYNMLAILVQMSVKQGAIQGGNETPAVPFNPAHKVFMKVIQDQDQSLGCRILAARGLLRICRDGENAPSSNERSDIATAILAALAANPPSNSDGIWWFRLRLIEALGSVDRIDNSATQPIVLEGLLDVIVDRQEVWLNRAVAAQCITQLPYASSTNVPLITSEVMNLLSELGTEFNKAPTALELREPFKRIYFSFRPPLQKQARERKWGLLYQVERTGLGTHAPYVKSAWVVAHPVLKPFMETTAMGGQIPAISAGELQAIQEWVQKNPPSNRRVMPNGKEYPANIPGPASVGAASK